MAQDLRFIDPAFTCEVVLTSTARALYDHARPEFERLEGLRSLGIIAQIHTVAKHTRHDHAVGLMRIFNKLCQQSAGRGLPKDFLWSFWCRLVFGQTGHAALGYDSEKAVLLACHLDGAFKEQLRALLQPVANSLTHCAKCTKTLCPSKDKGKDEAVAWLDETIERNLWQRLHRWVAGLKLLQHPKLLGILNAQKTTAPAGLGFSEAEALKILVAPRCAWDSPLRNLSRLDFIPRDLAFAGTLSIQLDVDCLVAAVDKTHPDWKLLSSLSQYMSENVYESLDLQVSSALYQRALAGLLINRKVTLEQLFGTNLNNGLNDDQLKGIVSRTKAGKQIFDADVRNGWHAWPVKAKLDDKKLPSEVEKDITGHAKGHLSRHVASRATCIKLNQKDSLGLAICHRDSVDRPQARSFVKLCRSLLAKHYPNLSTENVASALYEGLVDRECKHGLGAAVTALAAVGLPVQSLRATAELVNRRSQAAAISQRDVAVQIGGYTYSPGSDLNVNIMHAAISGDDNVRKNLGYPIPRAAALLWAQLLHWQSIYFGVSPSKTALILLAEVQNALAARVVGSAVTAEVDLEIYTLLESLKHPSASVSFRISLPNLKLMKDDGTVENEYDVVTVTLKQDKHVEVWVWGVTVEQNLTPKRNADMAKIQRLKDLLGQRWGSDVRVATCYVHRDGNEICREIDGCQDRCTFAPPPVPTVVAPAPTSPAEPQTPTASPPGPASP